ncbi:MAG: prenyltransferase/squalene oxidase repeat-containing protein, partial [Opitutales bacterium]
MDEENQYPEDLPGEEDYATGYEQASEPLPEEAYDDLPFEPVGGPIRETAMGRYMREHRLLNSMLMALLIMLVFFWAFWDLVLYGLTQGADGSDFSEAAVSRARKNPPKTNTNLVKRQKKPQPSAQPTTKAIAISDISMPNLSELNIATLAPVVETPGLSMGEMGSSDDAKKALQNLGLALPTPMKSRCDPQARINRLKQGGGKASTEEVIKKGLDWLKATQDKDGSWGANDKGPDGNKKSTDRNAMTGMALLCFLGHCELQDSADYGNTVHRAIEFLSSTPGNAFTGRECYSHPIRTYALCEAFTMTKIKKLESIAQIAAEAVIKGQNEDGGWAYDYKKGPTAHVDLSIAGWNIQALKAAALTGLYIDGLDEAMDKAIAYVKACQDSTGRFKYTKDRHGGHSGHGSLT